MVIAIAGGAGLCLACGKIHRSDFDFPEASKQKLRNLPVERFEDNPNSRRNEE
jgi:hypothetical protein